MVRHTEQAPQRIPMTDIKSDLYLCRCGLSQNGAFCDGSHKATRDENSEKLYQYRRDAGVLTRHEVEPTGPELPSEPPSPLPLPVAGGAA